MIKGLDEKPQLKVCFNVLGGSCRPVPEAEEEGDRRQTCQKEVANPFSSSGPAYTHTSFLLFWWRSVDAHHHSVVSLIGLQRELFLWFHVLCTHLLHF